MIDDDFTVAQELTVGPRSAVVLQSTRLGSTGFPTDNQVK